MIQVTKPHLPPKEVYQSYLDQIYESAWLTNHGKLVQQLEQRLEDYLGVKHLICVANGTLALQVALKSLNLEGEVITSPFSFPATSSALVWQGLSHVFSDIEATSFNLDPQKIESKISAKTCAILPVHVFGNPCDVYAIDKIAKKHQLPVIYDAAHAFDVKLNGQNILNFGDISTLSFHTTKLFHTIEGGAIVTNNDALAEKIRLLINFGISGLYQVNEIGINAKMNEFEAAMGLAILDEMPYIQLQRAKIWENYHQSFTGRLKFQKRLEQSTQNYAYAPVLFDSEKELLRVMEKLHCENIRPRRYFYPSLDTLDVFGKPNNCPVSQNIARRILCLPIYPDLTNQEQVKIIQHTLSTL